MRQQASRRGRWRGDNVGVGTAVGSAPTPSPPNERGYTPAQHRLVEIEGQTWRMITMNTKRALGVLVLLLVFTASCARQMYPGERLPQDQVARIERNTIKYFSYYSVTINIAEVDGQTSSGEHTEFEVLPGEHTVGLRLLAYTKLLLAPVLASKQFTFTPGKLTFRAEAGRRYKVEGEEVADYQFLLWVEDAETGSVVGGRKPEPPSPR